jgi:hypothetical protein
VDKFEATTALTEASRLSTEARAAGRWYARYLVLFGLAVLGLSVGVGRFSGSPGTMIVTGCYVAFIAGITAWAQTHRAVMRGMGRLHAVVIGSPMGLWALTVGLGTVYFADRLAWWLVGGLAMSVPAFVGAAVAFRRTRA